MRVSVSSIKSEIFKSLANNTFNKNTLVKEALMIKEKRDKKMNYYNEMDLTRMVDSERSMILEKANTLLLQYDQKIEMCDLYSKRSKSFMNCVIALENGNTEEYKKNVLEFAKEIKEQALIYKKMELEESRQKKIALYATKSWLRVLEQQDYSKWKASTEKSETQEKIAEENMKFFELGEDERILKIRYIVENTNFMDEVPETIVSAINSLYTNIQISTNDFKNTKLLDYSPLDSIGMIYPDINKKFLDLTKQRARTSK